MIVLTSTLGAAFQMFEKAMLILFTVMLILFTVTHSKTLRSF